MKFAKFPWLITYRFDIVSCGLQVVMPMSVTQLVSNADLSHWYIRSKDRGTSVIACLRCGGSDCGRVRESDDLWNSQITLKCLFLLIDIPLPTSNWHSCSYWNAEVVQRITFYFRSMIRMTAFMRCDIASACTGMLLWYTIRWYVIAKKQPFIGSEMDNVWYLLIVIGAYNRFIPC